MPRGISKHQWWICTSRYLLPSLGVLLISLALCADAVIGNVQEKALKHYSASNIEMVLFSYFIGFWYILVAITLTGSLQAAFTYCLEVLYMYNSVYV